jgi:hypothetical protein
VSARSEIETRDPAVLRELAEKCFRLAEGLPPGRHATELKRIGDEYLAQAEKLELSPDADQV